MRASVASYRAAGIVGHPPPFPGPVDLLFAGAALTALLAFAHALA